ncbi:hypothetical protein FSARC_11191 [Fusarium sarcochroum]|uniref:Zn(2)-C6 fungal-type domain-containing protein n=1 Tax=Fusarium sarcochroum TaxID=1208366 RepID=A0A8H4X0X1_9HYPO|nr:hypothetical protein FSARC_11191 [Fusarium sarcochroum]
MSSNPRPQRKRAKHTRSKLGCGVCRIRRVRCDRTRPACERCTKTGRQCDGYPVRDPSDANSPVDKRALVPSLSTGPASLSILPTRFHPSLDAQGVRALEYFQLKAAPELCGFFENDLWYTLVLQVSRRETCIQRMIIALGFLHESFHAAHTHKDSSLSIPNLRQRAISEYGSGLNHLNYHISTQGWANLEITVLCSILCVTFEWLRGDYDAAYTHLGSSILVLSQWTDGKSRLTNGTSPSSPGGYMIQTQLYPLWISLVLQARTMPVKSILPEKMPWLSEEISGPFTSLQEARKALDVLLACVLPVTISPKRMERPRYVPPFELTCLFDEWSDKFTAFLATQDLSERAVPRVTIMNLWFRTARIIFASTFSTDEITFDALLEEFTYIINKAEELLSSPETRYSVDIGVVPPLYYAALKCRDPTIRRRSVTILQSAPRREAGWDSLGTSCILKEVIRIEENGLGNVMSQYDVPGSARICDMHVVTDVENQKVCLKALQQGAHSWGQEKVFTW